jgi:hypothetical protein
VAVTLDAEAQRVTFAFGLPLQPGTHELSVNYRGVLNDQLAVRTRKTEGGGERDGRTRGALNVIEKRSTCKLDDLLNVHSVHAFCTATLSRFSCVL